MSCASLWGSSWPLISYPFWASQKIGWQCTTELRTQGLWKLHEISLELRELWSEWLWAHKYTVPKSWSSTSRVWSCLKRCSLSLVYSKSNTKHQAKRSLPQWNLYGSLSYGPRCSPSSMHHQTACLRQIVPTYHLYVLICIYILDVPFRTFNRIA